MVEYFAYFMLLWQKINMNFLNWKTNLSRRHPHQTYCENTMEKLITQQKANLYTFVFSELFDICNFTEKMVSVFSLVAILLLICTQLVATGKVHRCQLHFCAIFQPNNFRRFSREKKVVQTHFVFTRFFSRNE